ncbi:unnamed protein product [Urochloa humidicola]
MPGKKMQCSTIDAIIEARSDNQIASMFVNTALQEETCSCRYTLWRKILVELMAATMESHARIDLWQIVVKLMCATTESHQRTGI